MNLRREIGSEFELPSELYGENLFFEDEKCYPIYTLSGRTALDLVINDARVIRKVCVPSYCCSAMLAPFIERGIGIEYYPVYYTSKLNIDLSIPKDCDALLIMQYFGFESVLDLESIQNFKRRGGIVIEDISHMIFSLDACRDYSDYLVASIRKWGGLVSGGVAVKKGAPIKQKLIPPDPVFIENKLLAMRLKYEYLNGQEVEKDTFLNLFKQTNTWIEKHYHNRSIDQISRSIFFMWNSDQIVKRRRKNALCLYNHLCSSKQVKPMFEENQMRCPLFFPVIVQDGKRIEIQTKLRNYDIYCPVHWPKPDNRCDSNLYENELSIICDQRYDENDMAKIASVLLS